MLLQHHALLSQSGYFKERSLPRKEKSGSGAHGRASQLLLYVAQLPRPASVLALMEDGAVALGLHQGPDLGVHHPAAHRFATGPAPPPATLARFATRVPVQEMRQVSPRLKPGEEKRHDFFARGACFISILKEIRQFQWLRRTLKQGRVLEIKKRGRILSTFSRLRSPMAVQLE